MLTSCILQVQEVMNCDNLVEHLYLLPYKERYISQLEASICHFRGGGVKGEILRQM